MIRKTRLSPSTIPVPTSPVAAPTSLAAEPVTPAIAIDVAAFSPRAVKGEPPQPEPGSRASGRRDVNPAMTASSQATATGPTEPEPFDPDTHQVTGNGFGFAVYNPEARGLTQFFVHPYRFMRPNPKAPHGDGIETANVISHLGWSPAKGARTAQYQAQSQVISATSDAGVESYMMPFGLQRSALVTTLDPKDGKPASLDIKWSHPVLSRTQTTVSGVPVWLVKLKGVKETVVLVPLQPDSKPSYKESLTGSRGWALVSVEDAADAKAAAADVLRWQGGAAPAALPGREATELDAWRVKAPEDLAPDALRLWRQSETILRMAQIQEPNGPARSGKGLILASLPDGEWFIPWVRDMTYSVVALAGMGHQDEARQALDAMMNTRGVGHHHAPGEKDYQISTVRYFGNGAEEADQSGQAQPNLEYDSWGLALWSASQYVSQTGDVAWLQSPTDHGTTYEKMRDMVVSPLLDKLEPYGKGLIVTADSSVWEQNDSKRKHYAFSTIAAIAGLKGFLDLAKAEGDNATVQEVQSKLDQLNAGFRDAFVKDGQAHGSLEPSPRNDMDGALLEALNMGVITEPELTRSTLDRMSILKTASGGYRRVTGDTGYEKQEFLFINFALARAKLHQGQTAEADALVDRMVQKAEAHRGLVPEMYVSEPMEDFDGGIGAPTGAIPMVGYGAGAFINYELERRKVQPKP